jgi:hypothetical protein
MKNTTNYSLNGVMTAARIFVPLDKAREIFWFWKSSAPKGRYCTKMVSNN